MRKTDVRSIADIDLYLSEGRPRRIKLQNSDLVNDNTTLKSLFNLFINQSPATIFMRGGVHCVRNRYRSFYDYTLLAKYYFPDATIVDMLNVLFEYYYNSNNRQVKELYYCPDIRKYNFRINCYGSSGMDRRHLRQIAQTLRQDYREMNYNMTLEALEVLANDFVASTPLS